MKNNKNIKHTASLIQVFITYLLTNVSNPFRLSSMKSSSNMPSSPLNGIWRFHALPGNGGTTIYKQKQNSKN